MKEEKADEGYLAEILSELEKDDDVTDISEFDVHAFIHYCEIQYNMKTTKFLKWFKENNYKGNPDMKLWALYARNLGMDHE